MVHGVGTDLNQIDHGQVQASDVVAGRSKLPPRVPSLTWPWASKLELATSQMHAGGGHFILCDIEDRVRWVINLTSVAEDLANFGGL